jgi:predicted RNase H-like HicB family nuclease
MSTVYPAIFTQEGKYYCVEFPDLEGCQTIGESVGDAIDKASEALGLYLVALEEDKVTPPNASAPQSLKASENGFISVVSTELKKYRRNKSITTTVTLPLWLKEAAEQKHLSFSGVLQEALQQRLDVH